jgi:predicted GNAT family N-acyltransferase
METAIHYRAMQPGEEATVCEMIAHVFYAFVAPEYAEQGIQEFLKYIQPEALRQRVQENHFVLVAICQGRTVGAIEMRNHNHVSLLFVDGAFHHQGISRELLRRSLDICLKQHPTLTTLTVNSSPYAIEAYQHLGFVNASPEQEKNGIRFVPMTLDVSSYTVS